MYENDMKIIERAQNGSKEDMTKPIVGLFGVLFEDLMEEDMI